MRAARSWWLAALATLSACGGSANPGVEIRDAWSPLAPPGAQVVAVYASIVARNTDTLLSVSTPLAGSAQLHSTVEEDGMMRMRPLARLELKAGETLRLEPGGVHLMLTGVTQPLPADARIPLTFHFARAGSVAVSARVAAER